MSNDNSIIENNDSENQNKEVHKADPVLEKYKSDMFKYKKASKDKDALLEELQSRLNNMENEQLAEKEQWKTLYEKERDERESLVNSFTEKEQRHNLSIKRAALKQELGSVKDAYLVHADLNSVSLTDDGLVDSESLLQVANKFRQDYPELLPRQASATMTGFASPTNETAISSEKSLKDLSVEEIQQLLNNN